MKTSAGRRGANPAPGGLVPWTPEALGLLLEASDYAQGLGQDRWEFAVEVRSLYEAGLTNNDLRWLVCKGYLEHGVEWTHPGMEGRVFRRGPGLMITENSCYVLTGEGVALARQIALAGTTGADPGANPLPTNGHEAGEVEVPHWDPECRELRVRGHAVKRFRVPAPNQELVLSALQELGWPAHLDDPLPPVANLDPKRRLHDTIVRLNRNQRQRLVHFRGDGRGSGLCWEWAG